MNARINFSDLSRYRGELMGIATLMVVMFHIAVQRTSPFFGIHRIGNSGVDIFMLVSGIGMWYSWTKVDNPSTLQFFKRRYARIYPTWLIVALAFYGTDYLTTAHCSTSLADLAGDVLFHWDYWLSGDYSFWYIPAIMMLYTFTPAYLRLIIRHPVYRWLPVLAMVWSCVVQWVPAVHGPVGHIEAFWSRIPIFFIGINLGQAVKENRTIEGGGVWMPVVTFVLTLGVSIYLEQFYYGRYPLFIERMIYIPMVVSGALVVGMLLHYAPQWFNRSMAFVGTLSLEVYLVHEHFVHVYIRKLALGYWPTFLIVVAATLPVAWALNWLAKKIENKILKR